MVTAGESRILLAEALADAGLRPEQRRELAVAGAELLREFASSSELVALADRLAGGG